MVTFLLLFFVLVSTSWAQTVQIRPVYGTRASAGLLSVTDGPKGDIEVSLSGTVWTIVPDAVTNAKLADMPATTLKGNPTASPANPADLTPTTVKMMLGLDNVTNTSDAQKWVLPKKLENTRLKKRVLTQADPIAGTPTPGFITIDADSFDIIKIAELSQNTTFNPPTGTHDVGDLLFLEIFTTVARTITFSTAANGFIADANLALPTVSNPAGLVKYLFEWNGSKWSLAASSQTTTRGVLDECYRSNGPTAEPGFRECLANASVTYAKLQNVSAASRLLGRGSAAGAGSPQEVTLGANCTMTGTELNCAGGGGIAGTIGTIHLPVDAVKFPTSDAATVDGSELNARLLFDNAVRKCAYWGPFRMNSDYSSLPVFKLQYAMTSAITGGIAMDVEVMAVAPGAATDLTGTGAADSYATVNTCTDTAVPPTTAGKMEELSCSLVNDDTLAAGNLTKIRLCRNVSHATDTAAGTLEALAASLEYTR